MMKLTFPAERHASTREPSNLNYQLVSHASLHFFFDRKFDYFGIHFYIIQYLYQRRLDRRMLLNVSLSLAPI